MHKPVFEALPDASGQGLEQLLDEVYRTGETFQANERPVELLRNGKWESTYLNFVYEPYRDATGEILGILAIAVEVTDQVLARQKIEEIVKQRTEELGATNEALLRTNEELSRSNENLQEFAYAASHDLKEPIRKMHIFGGRLKVALEARLNEEEKRLFEKMELAAKRMNSLVDDLLSYSQVSLGANAVEPVDLDELVQLVLSDLDLEIEQKGAAVRAGKLFTIKGHHRQLQQVFHNLIGNSLKYCKPDVPPEITISCHQVAAADLSSLLPHVKADCMYHACEIRDNGIGFDQQDAERIFNVFTRLHGDKDFRGSGVGLSIVRKVIENHQGYIKAESSPGQGSSFRIYLPENP
jgi:light-regulated signal transduction histidine kinase (bacteriophytochrome)